ncbi:MAG: PTS transporter subunit EIIC [Clostridium sp.]|uniref:PTS sugar transporter subunit IIC n=1 Tax=Clostridium sp. TaxID=1506 RepID=UPI0029074D72|nr:PTS transporter subunit EIIC [Clostridium sp.]MDU4937013.1 PTS transporter subunit EIIC [Clostridium sp.]
MKSLENFLNKWLIPIADKAQQNNFVSSLAEAFMRCMPITVGIALLTIVGNFPITGWIEWLAEVGLTTHFNAVLGAVTNAISIYVVFNFAFVYTNREGKNGHAAGLLAIASFLMLMPQLISSVDASGQSTLVEGFLTSYTGGSGLLAALIIGYAVAKLYCILTDAKITVKMPESVPTMVSESLSPTILSIIILTLIFLVRVGFSATHFGNFFDFITKVVQAPLVGIVASPWALILIATIGNILWFFGIHTNILAGVLNPILYAIIMTAIPSYQAGDNPTAMLMSVVVIACSLNWFGGSGAMYGLIISMITAKSKRYKQMFKISVVPVVFNIAEPLLFGMPMMLNPLFFIPMIIQPALLGGVGMLLVKVFDITQINASMALLPWTLPAPFKFFIGGGAMFLLVFAILLVLNFITYYPFFKVADRKALAEEREEVTSN